MVRTSKEDREDDRCKFPDSILQERMTMSPGSRRYQQASIVSLSRPLLHRVATAIVPEMSTVGQEHA